MFRMARLYEIQAHLERDGSVTVSELAGKLRKTQITIRRDLQFLESEGVLRRTHGGAVACVAPHGDFPRYDLRERAHPKEKSTIARKAAEFITDGDSLIINAGTTTHELAFHLRRFNDLQVVTNGLTLAPELAHSPNAQVLMIGGETDFMKLGTVGPVAEEMMENIHVTKAFLGVAGVSLEHGLLMYSPAQARINAAFVRSANHVTVLVDSSKFASNFIYRVAPLGDVDRIITDSKIEPDIRDALEQAGPELIIVKNR